MTVHERHPKEFLVGAVVGTLLGGVSTLLLAPQSGDELREDISHTYHDFARKTHAFADELARRKHVLAKMADKQNCCWTNKAKRALDSISNGVKSWGAEEEMEHGTKDFIVGGIIGGVLGAVAGLLLAPKPGHDLRDDLADNYHHISDRTHEIVNDLSKSGKRFVQSTSNRSHKWLDFVKGIVEEFADDVQEAGHEASDRAKEFSNHRVDEIMDLASLGFRLWKKLKK